MAARVWPYRGQPNVVSWPRPWPCAGAGRRIVGAASAVSWAQAPCHGALCCALGCRVLGCLAIQPCLKPFLAIIQHVYCDTLLPSSHCPSCCVTIQFLCIKTQSLSPLAFLLQYSPTFISAIQTIVLQHKNPYTSLLKPLSCNTNFFFRNIIWAVAQKRLCTKFFFFVIHFPLFPATGKILKKKY